jgi:hypothetical protein
MISANIYAGLGESVTHFVILGFPNIVKRLKIASSSTEILNWRRCKIQAATALKLSLCLTKP